MIFLADSKNLEEVEHDLGESVGQLLTPLTYRRNFRPTGIFGIDNGCFKRFEAKKYWSMLEREAPNAKFCKFVTVPDVVGDARRTLELFNHFRYDPRLCKFPIALVCQNGQEDLPIDWDRLDAVFIGGDDRFKTSAAAHSIIKTAQILGKWTHVGRVNSPIRWGLVEEWGVDSCDGSGLAQYSEMRHKIRQYKDHPQLKEIA